MHMCTYVQIAIDCNENIRRAENEFKLFTITKRCPHDDVELVTVKTNIRHRGNTETECCLPAVRFI